MQPTSPSAVPKGGGEGHKILPYTVLVERAMTKNYDGLADHNLEAYLSNEEFLEKFGMDREAFDALPKWRQKMKKQVLQLF
mmetsp:Transcript_31503/g.99915  ORF Transcript_31503/g.99915 Transcript_31503/m.99915 type:complete len:81 (+) Transcript_31503:188-430(+)